MAIIQNNITRNDDDNLFAGIEITPQNQKISSAEELLDICKITAFPVDLSLILQHLITGL